MNKAHPDCISLNWYITLYLQNEWQTLHKIRYQSTVLFHYLNLELDADLDFPGTLKEDEGRTALADSMMPTVA